MKLSYHWLKELADLGGTSPEELAHRLTFHTVGVESVTRRGDELDGVVTARVTRVRPHPGADRLRLCTVDAGQGADPIEVVCGAPNVAEGQTVLFAPEGVVLPNGLKLTRRAIRGVESAGMICAEDELGLGEDHAGIVVLEEGTALGVPAADALAVRDAVLEIENPDLTHRPDLWGHVGFAREAAALLGAAFEPPGAPRADAAFEAARGEGFPVGIEDEEGCRRYVAVVLEGVQNGPSPRWLRSRLEALGVRSLGLLVDLTNLVMLEQGQPIHAFDIRDLAGGRIVVRRATDGEPMTTLDGVERRLTAEDLVIADGSRPVALAGVMGGENSEVRPDTTTLLLESANFDPVRVRRSAQRHKLRTEASTRFEKHLDPERALAAARRFTELVLDLCPGARVVRRVTDVFPRPPVPRVVDLPYVMVGRRLGMKISDAEIRQNLLALGFEVEEEEDVLHVRVPSWRATKDVECDADLVEEVGRIRGYATVPSTPPVGALTPTRPSPLRRLSRRVAVRLSDDLGLNEVMSYAYYGPRDVERLGMSREPHVELANPLTEDQDRMAKTTAAALLAVAAANATREPRGRVWEESRLVLVPEADALPAEIRVVGLLAWDAELAEDPEGTLVRDLLEDVKRTLEAVPVDAVRVREARGDALAVGLPAPVWLHPGRAAVVEGGGTSWPSPAR